MKHTPNKTLLAMAAAAALLLSGCTKELPNEGFGEGSYLSLSIDGQQAPSTAAYAPTATSAPSTASAARQGASMRAVAVSETAVNNLWVLQFKMTNVTTGTLVKRVYIPTVTDMTKIPYLPEVGTNMMLYLVANTNDAGLFTKIAIGDGIDKVKAQTVAISATAGNNFPTDTSPNLPMVGQSTLYTFPATRTVQVNLTRTVAKVILKVTNGLTTGFPLLKVTSTQLKKVPQIYSTQLVNAASGFTGTNYYPPVSGTNYYRDYITATGTTATYYVAPNVRGTTGTATDERLKTDVTAPSGQGPYCTYVEILGTAKATATSPEVDVRYRLYLGGNNTNDYNLYSNIAYNVDIKLTGLSAADARLKITTDKFDLVQGGVDDDYTSDAGDGWVQPAVGDYYFTDGTTSSKLVSGKTANGIVYYVDPVNPEKFKIFSLDQGSNLIWAAKNTYVLDATGRSETDGKVNVTAMKLYSTNNTNNSNSDKKTTGIFATDFPAAEFCDRKNKGGVIGWYMPAKDELEALSTTYNADNTLKDALVGVGTNIDGIFWSSTEDGGYTSDAWIIMIINGFTNNKSKVETSSVRCVRKN